MGAILPFGDDDSTFAEDLFDLLNKGKLVLVVAERTLFNIVDACTILGVERNYLLRIAKDIPHVGEGMGMRFMGRDLLAYREAWHARRAAAIDEMLRASEESGT